MAKTRVTGEYLKDSVVRFTAKAGENITKGNAVYISGISGELPVVSLADADDTAKMPAFGLAEATVLTNAEVEVTSFGTLADLDTSSYTLGDILYVGTTAGALTNDPAGLEATKLQNIGIVQRVHASNGSIKVGGAGRTNAVPNLDNGDIFIGNSDNKAVSSALSTEIESYLDGGTSTPTFASATVSGDLTVDTSTLKVDSTNNRVGIGTASPSSQLHIVGNGGGFTKYERTDTTINNNDDIGAIDFAHTDTDNAGVAATILCSGDGTGGQARLTFYTGTPTSRAERLRIASDGSIGVNTSSPISLGGHDGVVTLYGSNATALILQNSTSSSRLAQLGSDLGFFVATHETERMRLTSTGLGIGTSSPVSRLTVDGATTGFAASGITLKRTGSLTGSSDIILAGNSGTEALSLRVNQSEKLRVTHDGSVGIGTSNPNGILHIKGPNDASTYITNQKSSTKFSEWHVGGSNHALWWDSTADMRFGTETGLAGTGASVKMTILSGGGITFNGDTAAANALDDYEEGTWTPTTTDASNLTSPVVGSATYRKVGSLVYINFEVTGSVTSSTAETRIAISLPFVADSTTYKDVGHVAFFSGTNANRFGVGSLYLGTVSNSLINIYVSAGQMNTNTSTEFRCSLVYRAA